MKKLTTKVRIFFEDEHGATAVEYAVILGFIIAVCAGGVKLIGGTTTDNLAKAEDCFP